MPIFKQIVRFCETYDCHLTFFYFTPAPFMYDEQTSPTPLSEINFHVDINVCFMFDSHIIAVP